MSKQEIIEAIRQHNHTAPSEFLSGFADEELELYLRRLTQVLGHRGRGSHWVRESQTHAAVLNA